MDTALPQKFPFILDRNLAKANCTGNHVCTSCDNVVLGNYIYLRLMYLFTFFNVILISYHVYAIATYNKSIIVRKSSFLNL